MQHNHSVSKPLDPNRDLNRRLRASAGVHLVVSLAAGIVTFLVLIELSVSTAALTGWAVAASVFLLWTWTAIWNLDASDTQRIATREDASAPIRDLVILVVALGSLVVVSLVVFRAHQAGAVRTWLGVAGIVLAWFVLQTVFTLRYARLYYTQPAGGIEFHSDEDPTFRDFAYMAFTVGMTFQVSDTDIGRATIRHTVLRQALVSYAFGAVIIAVTVNLVAGLASNH